MPFSIQPGAFEFIARTTPTIILAKHEFLRQMASQGKSRPTVKSARFGRDQHGNQRL